MRRSAWLLFPIAASFCAGAVRAQDPPMPAAPREARIIGGNPASPGAWPWQIALFHQGADGQMRPICGGSLIARDWVLTAAHCVAKDPKGAYRVGYGSNHISTDKIVDVAEVVPHESYDSNIMENDLALVKLAQPADVGNESLARLPIARDIDPIPPGSAVTVTGFGTTALCGGGEARPECSMQDQLRETEVPLVATENCRSDYAGEPQTIGEHQLCAGNQEGGKDSCQGDSGGPLVHQEPEGWTQVGIVSWGRGCAVAGKPGIYTRVAAYAQWISTKLGGGSVDNPVNVVAGPSDSGDATRSGLVSVSVQGGSLRVGSTVDFTITSRVSGYLLVIDVSPAGNTTQLFPNQYSGTEGTAATISAGQSIEFPSPSDTFAIRVPEPVGQGLVVAVVTRSPEGLSDLNKSFGDLKNVRSYHDYYARLGEVMRDKSPINPLSGKGDWAMGEAHYQVVH